MPSELWQRIRAARKYADLRQQDVADVCKVSRAAVAQWEYDDMERRTTPSIDQMKALAKLSGVPLDWLLNDRANLDDIYRYAKVPAPPPVVGSSIIKDTIDELVKAQQFDAIPGFYRPIGAAGLSADFMLRDIVVQFEDTFSLDAVAKMLMLERATGPARKVLMVRENVPPETVREMKDVFGVTVLPATTARKAADEIRAYLQ